MTCTFVTNALLSQCSCGFLLNAVKNGALSYQKGNASWMADERGRCQMAQVGVPWRLFV